MAYIPADSALASSDVGLLTRIGRALSRGLARWIEINSRADQLAALHAKSDAELAAMNLRREDIVLYVFRDRAMY